MEGTQASASKRSAMLKPKDTLALSGAMNLSRSSEDLKTTPQNAATGKAPNVSTIYIQPHYGNGVFGNVYLLALDKDY